MGSLTQTVIGMPCEKGIDADHCEHRLTADAVDRCFELGCKIVVFACLRKQRPDPFADAYIAPLYRILVTKRDQKQLIDTLKRIESDEIGTAVSDPNKLGSVANSLLGLKVSLD